MRTVEARFLALCCILLCTAIQLFAQAPAPPQNLSVMPGNGIAILKWNRNTESDFLRYRVYQSNAPNPTAKVDSSTTNINDTTNTRIGLANGVIYHFRVTAVDSMGLESLYSNDVLVVPSVLNAQYEYNPDASTVLLFHLDEVSGSAAIDASSHSNNGTATGTTIVNGRFGKARSFGTTLQPRQRVTVPSISALNFGTNPYTLDLWISPNIANPYYILSKGPSSGASNISVTMNTDSTVQVSSNASLKGKTHIVDGGWHHLAVIGGADPVRLFVDGKLDAVGTISANISNSDSLVIGAPSPAAYGSDAVIDELRVSNIARSPQEFNLQLPPTNLTANSSGTTINLSWQNGGGVAPLMRYKIYRGADSTNVVIIDSTASTAYANTGLVVGNTYYYCVSAVDSTGFEGAKSNATRAITNSPPAAPQNLAVTDSSNQSITVKWRRNTEADFLRYRIYRGIISGTEVEIDSTTGGNLSDTSRTHTGLTNGTRYYFRVTAVDSAGLESGYSNEVNATPNLDFRVLSTTPARNALNVETNAAITVTFGLDANASTFTNSTIKINGSLSGPHAAIYNYNSSTKTVTITTATVFKVGEVVTTTLTRGIRSATGDSLIKSCAWSFSIKSNANSGGKFVQSSTPTVGSSPYSVTAGDFNGDGYIDLAITNYTPNTVSILLNDGNGTFAQSTTASVGSNPYSVTAGDFNGDGSLDLAVANGNSNTVTILFNNGSGSFTQSSTPTVGSNPQSLTTGDWNGDGAIDLAVMNNGSHTVSILINNGSGGFTQSSVINVGMDPRSITSGDWDGDGVLDLAVANYGPDSISILIGDGDGRFRQSSTVSVGMDPRSITSGDWNGDGKLDLAVANNSGTLSVLTNDGNGGFSQSSTVSIGVFPSFVIGGDWNGDGFLDLAVVNGNQSDIISVLTNNGTGIFTQTSTMSLGNVVSMVSGDWNGDGALDLAAINNNSNTVSVLRNRSKSASISLPFTTIDLGVVGIGSSKSRSLKITNNGTDSSLVISNITSSKAVFTLNRTSLTIPGGGTDSVQVTFSPIASSSFADSLQIYSNDPRNPVSAIYLSGYSGNYISGVILSNTTWTKPNSPYIINGNTAVDAGVTLAIQNGVNVVFNGKYGFNIDGILQTNGIAGDSVVFTSVSPDTVFPGIILRNGSNSTFSYAKLQYAMAAITAQSGSTVSIRNSRFVGNTTGFKDSTSSATIILRTSTFDHNTTGVLATSSAILDVDSLTFSSNSFGLACGYSTTTIRNSSITNNGTGITDGGIGGNLTVTNCDIVSNSSYGIYGQYLSTLNVNHSRILRNTLYGIVANSATGTVTGSTFKSNGGGISSASSNLSFTFDTVITNTGIGIQTSTNGNISHNVISGNSSHGLVTDGTSTIASNNILNNGGDGVHASNTPSLSFNRLYGNTGYNLRATKQTSDSIIARNNYWGAANDADISLKIFDYYDDGVTVKVQFKPYFTKPIFPPQNLAASSSVGQMKLTWNKGNPPSNFLRYRIYGGSSTAPTSAIDSTGNPGDSVKVLTGLTPGAKYYFRMTTIDSAGLESDYSNEVNCFQLPLVQIYSVTPTPNQSAIVANTPITVKFSLDVNSSTLTNSTVKVNASLSGLHTATFNYNSTTKTATITPNSAFKAGDVVTTTLTRGIKGTANDSLASPFTWGFTIGVGGGSGTFTRGSKSNVGNQPYSVTAGDFNGDGALDLAVANASSNTVSILLNNGTGLFVQSSTPTVGTYPLSIAAGDFNGDGALDLAVANSMYSTVSILLNNGTGVFTQSSTPNAGSSPYSIATGDFNGDGSIDLALANNSPSGSVTILLNDGNGTFTQGSTISVGSHPYSVAAGDFNGDGALDLAVANSSSNTVSILLNNGLGTFTQTSTPGVGNYPCAIVLGDFNNDGALDIAVAHTSPSLPAILLNNGSGIFAASSVSSTGDSPRDIEAGDWNGDGFLDLVVLNSGPNLATLSILKNNGSGTIAQTATDTVLSTSSWSITSGDFNGDGALDLAVANLDSNTVSIYLNRRKTASLGLSSNAISFGAVVAGTTKSLYFRMTNNGTDSTLVISSIVSSGQPFGVDRTSLSIAPTTTDSIKVTFAPPSGGSFVDTLSISSNDLNKPILKVVLSGEGVVPPLAPVLVFPPNGGINQSTATTFRWNSSSGAARYSIQVGTDSTFATGIAVDDSTVTDTVKYVGQLATSTKYFWHVSASNIAGTSAYSSYWSFSTSAVIAHIFGEYQPDTSTVLLLHMNETSSSTVNDASSYANNGTTTGTTIVNGRFGKARQFSAADSDLVTIENESNFDFTSQSFTIEAWLNPVNSGQYQTILGKSSTTDLSYRLRFSPSGALALWLYTSEFQIGANGYGVQTADSIITFGLMHHYAGVVDWSSSEVKIYKDGLRLADISLSKGAFPPVPIHNGSEPVRIGAYSTANYLNGILDEVRISNIARSPQEFDLQLPPRNLTATTLVTTVNLNWQNGGGAVPLMRYRIYRGSDSTNVLFVDSTINSSYSNTGLLAGSAYYYRVTAVDSTGFEGAKSYAASATVSSGALAAPILLYPFNGATNVSLGDSVKWNPVAGAWSYAAQIGTDSSFIGGMIVNDTLWYGTVRFLSSAVLGTKYYWRVRARDSAASGPYSPVWNFTTGSPNTPVVSTDAPTNITANSIHVSGFVNPNGYSTTYHFDWGLTTSYGNSTNTKSAGSGISGVNVSEDLTSLTPSTTYHFRLVATNINGTTNGSDHPFVTAAPDNAAPTAPVNPTVTPAGWTNAAIVTIAWQNPNDPSGITKVWYRYDASPDSANPGTGLAFTTSGGGGSAQIPAPASAGVHTLYFYLEDGASPTTNKDPRTYATVLVHFDNEPPVIQHDSLAVSSFQTGNPQSIPIQASATDVHSGMKTLQLQYHRSGLTWTGAPSVSYSSPSGGTALILASDLTTWASYGVDYRVSALDSANNQAFTSTHSILIRTNSTVTRRDPSGNAVTQVSVSSLPSGTEQFLAYRLFSVPMVLDNKTPQDVLETQTGLGSYDTKVWRFYKLNDDDSYSEYPDFSSQSVINIGKAFFLVLRNGIVLKTGPGTIVKAEDLAKSGVQLKTGFNFVGNPFNFDVPTDSLSVTNYSALLNSTFTNNWWEFAGVNGTNAGWKPNPTSIKAWEGIVIKTQAATTLKFNITDRPKNSAAPNIAARKGSISKIQSKIARTWTLKIKGVRIDNGMVDEENVIGVDPDASEDGSKSDMSEPPMFTDAKTISVAFPKNGELLTHDFQAPNDVGYFWDFRVRTPDRAAKLQLTFEGIDSLPNAVYLVDIDQKMAWTVTKQTQISLNSGNGNRNFRIIIGDKQFAEKNSLGIDLVPKAFKLFANYPNPFNPETVIRYTLPDNTSTYHVTLRVYNILGQEVKTLVDYAQQAGYYEISFSARNLSSGVYIYRLSVGGEGSTKFVDQKKMLLIK